MLAYVLTANLGFAAPGTATVEYPVAPYTDWRHLLTDRSGPALSAYAQPWRGYLETRSGRDLAAGVGLNYNLPVHADHDAVIGLFARSGIRHLRMEVPFSATDWYGRIKPAESYLLSEFLRGTRKHGIRPLVLLNAHSGAPGPSASVTRSVAEFAPRGARTIRLDDVSGLVPGRSGLSNMTEYRMAETLFTAVDPAAGTVTLSRPLPVDLPAGPRQVDTLKYAPLHPVGTAEFEASAGGWTSYASAVLDAVAAEGVTDFDVEIWNELSFASHWLEAANYHDPYGVPRPDFLHPGGTAWELARRTTALVKSRAPAARVVWGFSNTTFHHTASSLLPAGTDGESYHPYGTGIEWERSVVPAVRKVMPEGWAHLGTRHEQLPRTKLAPWVRGGGLHLMTEHGLAPREIGVVDEPRAQALKAAMALRSLGFWLNKGVDVVDLYSAYDADPAGYGMLPSDGAALMTPQLRALANFTAPLAGATADPPTQLTVAAVSYGPQPEVLPGMSYREMLAVLPFQVSPAKFAVGVYVMSYDFTDPPPPMSFRVTLGRLPFGPVRVSLFDPATGATTPVPSSRGAAGEVVVELTLDDRFRWLLLDAAPPSPALRARPAPFRSVPPLPARGRPVHRARRSY